MSVWQQALGVRGGENFSVAELRHSPKSVPVRDPERTWEVTLQVLLRE
jgi:hypothetical protein